MVRFWPTDRNLLGAVICGSRNRRIVPVNNSQPCRMKSGTRPALVSTRQTHLDRGPLGAAKSARYHRCGRYAFRIDFCAETQLAHLNKTKSCEVEMATGKSEGDVIRVAAGALGSTGPSSEPCLPIQCHRIIDSNPERQPR